MFLDGGLRFGSIWAIFDLFLRLSFLEWAKVTVICSKNDRRLSFLDSKKVTDACYFWNQKSVMWLTFSKYNIR